METTNPTDRLTDCPTDPTSPTSPDIDSRGIDDSKNDQNTLRPEHNKQELTDEPPKIDSGFNGTHVSQASQSVSQSAVSTHTTTAAEEPKIMARRIFDDLVSKNAEANPSMEKGVLEQEYREALISNRFDNDVINAVIKGMENDKIIEKVGTDLGCDILRVID